MAKIGGKRPGAGRKRGSLNKATTEIKAIALPYAPEAVKTLVAIMQNAGAENAARIAASKEILDRAYGKAPQGLEIGGGGNPIKIVFEM
jgi:hypothetical protein